MAHGLEEGLRTVPADIHDLDDHPPDQPIRGVVVRGDHLVICSGAEP